MMVVDKQYIYIYIITYIYIYIYIYIAVIAVIAARPNIAILQSWTVNKISGHLNTYTRGSVCITP